MQRTGGLAAIVYRRQGDGAGRDRLQRVAALAPLAFSAGLPLLREAVAASTPDDARPAPLGPGPFLPLDADWGARTACYALIAAGLTDGERLMLAARRLRAAHADEAAWWLGLLSQPDPTRPLRALRILTEAVQ